EASHTTATEEADSSAEREADRLVSLTPEKIVLMLRQEPGLSVEVKKLLVRRAYSQGRVVDPKELSDDAVFRLVRDDEEVRSLVTQQIVDRGYVRAKPTREELARQAEEQQRLEEKNAQRNPMYASSQRGEGNEGSGYGPSQRAPSQSLPYGTTQPGQQQSQPQDQINTDQRRALLQASTDETPQ